MGFSAEDAAWDQLRDEYPDWSIWTSDAGRWYATRLRRSLSYAEIDQGMVMTACADSLDELLVVLAAQQRLASQAIT